jgi:hypothetical protein
VSELHVTPPASAPHPSTSPHSPALSENFTFSRTGLTGTVQPSLAALKDVIGSRGRSQVTWLACGTDLVLLWMALFRSMPSLGRTAGSGSAPIRPVEDGLDGIVKAYK